ncbi:glycoside hydrolase family 5 protein [Sphaerobolus stellatus SS14]|nr:glycoside hydrolase family 5 protein [Sphaerobolus stellatus SS14]
MEAFQFCDHKDKGLLLQFSGGWFVLEPWITPSFFEATNNSDVVDEFTLGQLVDYNAAQKMLEQHWATWYTEDDFVQIAKAGLNFVRIPLGYWSIPTNESVVPYHSGAYPYFLDALGWARKHGLYTLVDLHGAPGSQNGYDNSGQRTSTPVWGVNPDNVTRTLDVMSTLISDIGDKADAIELMNEAAGFLGGVWPGTIRNYFQNGYDLVRKTTGNNNMTVVIGDAFLTVSSWPGFLTAPTAVNTMMDLHQYQIFSNDMLALSRADHITSACGLSPPWVAYAQSNIWTVMGEWSTAITDCAKWLNGRNVGARWDGTYPGQTQVFGNCSGLSGDSSQFADDYKTFLRQYWEVQVDAGEAVNGWIYWAWKTEEADEWSYQKGLEGGWIPQDPSQRLYPSICS